MAGPVLWLLRHGKAADAITFQGGDAARPLTERGERQSKASGETLAQFAPTVDAILTSPRLRALQTATIASEAHGSAPEPIVIDEIGGDYGLSELLALASPWLEADGSPNVVIVGHNPTLSILVHQITGDERGLSTGALAGIELIEQRLVALVKPPK